MFKKAKLALGLVCGLSSSLAFADFLPPNNLHLQDTILSSNVTEEEFDRAIELVQDIYGPMIREVHGGRLNIRGSWSNNTVNANASQFFGTWSVNMYGGLARRPEVTIDGFTLVICHEMGHHLGGYPFIARWAANEGQSDYYTTQICAKMLWADDIEKNATFAENLDPFPKELCDSTWDIQADRDLCYRSMAASKSLANLLASLKEDEVAFDTPDLTVVEEMRDLHPEAQCRLDTYMAGALCTADFDFEAIPGKDLGSRRNSAQAEEISRSNSCSRQDDYEIGVRPPCWFKSKL